MKKKTSFGKELKEITGLIMAWIYIIGIGFLTIMAMKIWIWFWGLW